MTPFNETGMTTDLDTMFDEHDYQLEAENFGHTFDLLPDRSVDDLLNEVYSQ